MDRLSQIKTALLTVAILQLVPQLGLYAQPQAGKRIADHPNIIFILADDQGWNGTSVQMHPDLPNSKSDFYRTPNIEKLAANGLRFSHAYSPGPMCSPTRASLQTGKSPAQLRMTNVGGGRQRAASPSQRVIIPPHSSSLSTEEVTIGETLQKAGYATAWFGKWHLGGDGPGAHGYNAHDGPTGNADGNTNDPANPKDIFGITDRGIKFMEKNVEAGKPFYLQLWHYAVHGPIQCKDDTKQACIARPSGKIHQSTDYAAMTEDLDAGVGMILDKVKQLGISDNTYIVYMSDHGAGRNLSSNAPLNQGKGSLWEGGMRVPLIISGPGVKSGAFCSLPTVGWDMFPTFCDLAGVDQPLPKGLEGVSLRPVFNTGEAKLDRSGDHIAFHFPHYANVSPMSTITVDGFKLVKFYDTNETKLFDLKNDIGESNDLSKQDPKKTSTLDRQLADYLTSVNAGMPTPNPGFDPTAAAETGGRTGRRGSAGGRGGSRQAQIAERKKELSALVVAFKQNDMKKVGELIVQMKKAIENAPTRGRGTRPGSSDSPSPRERRQQEILQLEKAHKASDNAKIGELIEQMKQRIKNAPAQTEGRGQRQRRPAQRESGSNDGGN